MDIGSGTYSQIYTLLLAIQKASWLAEEVENIVIIASHVQRSLSQFFCTMVCTILSAPKLAKSLEIQKEKTLLRPILEYQWENECYNGNMNCFQYQSAWCFVLSNWIL